MTMHGRAPALLVLGLLAWTGCPAGSGAPDRTTRGGVVVEDMEAVTLRGRVVDGNGEPIQGATVRYLPDPPMLEMMGLPVPTETGFFTVDFGALRLSSLPETLTDAAGRFEIRSKRFLGDPERLFERNHWNKGGVLIQADGYATALPGYHYHDPPVQDFGEIVLEPELAVVGTVLAEDGQPLEGVVVRLEHLGRWYPRRRMLDSYDILRLGGLDQTRTGQDGSFRFGGLSTGGSYFSMSLDGYATVAFPTSGAAGETRNVGTLTLPRTGTIQGKVVDTTGSAVAEADVWLADASFDRRQTPGIWRATPRWYGDGSDWKPSQLWDLREYGVPHARTDGFGHFEIQGRGSPSYDVYAHSEESGLAHMKNVPVGPSDITIALDGDRIIPAKVEFTPKTLENCDRRPVRFEVQGPTGAPTEGASVYAVWHAKTQGDIQGQSGPDGVLRLDLCTEYRAVYAQLEEVGISDRIRIPADPAAADNPVRLGLRAAARVSGTAHDADGSVAPYAWVSIEPFDDEGDPLLQPHPRDVRADAKGVFAFSSLPPGTYALNVGIVYEGQRGERVVVAPGEAVVVRALPQRGSTRIQGRVASAGVGVAGAEIEGHKKEEPFGYYGAWTGEDGNFDGWVEHPGTYEITATTRDGGRAGPKTLEVAEGKAHKLDFNLPTGSITGRVVGEDGGGVGGAFVFLASRDEEEARAADFTKADGAFRFLHLPDGDYTLLVMRRVLDFDHARLSLPTQSFEVRVDDGKATSAKLEVSTGLALSGNVRLPSGTGSRDGTAVHLLQVEPEPDPRFLDDGYSAVTYSWAGRYVFRGLIAGRYRVLAEAGSADDVLEHGTLIALGPEDALDVDLTQSRPGPRPGQQVP